jgi:hypothetical protein
VVRANPPEEEDKIINEGKIRMRIIIILMVVIIMVTIMISMMMILTMTITTTLMMRGIKNYSILFMHPMRIAAIKIDLDLCGCCEEFWLLGVFKPVADHFEIDQKQLLNFGNRQ